MSALPFVKFDELTLSKRIGIAWGFFWRAIAAAIGSGFAGGIVGGVMGFAIAIANQTMHLFASNDEMLQQTRIIGGCVGLLIGMLAFWFYIRWLFAARIRGYRLRLLADPG